MGPQTYIDTLPGSRSWTGATAPLAVSNSCIMGGQGTSAPSPALHVFLRVGGGTPSHMPSVVPGVAGRQALLWGPQNRS